MEIPAFKLIPKPQSNEAARLQGFKWAAGDIGARHQLGGQPNFLQSSVWPRCPGGHGDMTFYAQIDSVGDEICIADCGMIYVFICFDCYQTASFVQSN